MRIQAYKLRLTSNPADSELATGNGSCFQSCKQASYFSFSFNRADAFNFTDEKDATFERLLEIVDALVRSLQEELSLTSTFSHRPFNNSKSTYEFVYETSSVTRSEIYPLMVFSRMFVTGSDIYHKHLKCIYYLFKYEGYSAMAAYLISSYLVGSNSYSFTNGGLFDIEKYQRDLHKDTLFSRSANTSFNNVFTERYGAMGSIISPLSTISEKLLKGDLSQISKIYFQLLEGSKKSNKFRIGCIKGTNETLQSIQMNIPSTHLTLLMNSGIDISGSIEGLLDRTTSKYKKLDLASIEYMEIEEYMQFKAKEIVELAEIIAKFEYLSPSYIASATYYRLTPTNITLSVIHRHLVDNKLNNVSYLQFLKTYAKSFAKSTN